MNKKLFTLLSGVAIITSASLQSCADEFDPAIVTKQDAMANEYAQNFVNRYGTPDPNHTWGLGKIESMGFFSKAGTRATSDNVNVNRNEWTSRNRNPNPKVYNSNALINDVKVPGWPNFDGFYYASKGQDKKDAILTEAEMWADENYRPVGDVTDYEIKYVSNWFRTHKKPTSISLHLTDFFIQNISADADQIKYNEYTWPTDGSMPDDGGYNGANVERASDITGEVPADIKSAKTQDYKKGNITRRQPNYADENINYAVDQLQFMSIGGDKDNISGTGWTHVNNFNAGNSNYNPESKNVTENREIMYVYSSGTEDFACKSVMGDSQPWINNWVLVYLEWKEPGADGIVRDRSGYYLGFDFQCKTDGTIVDPDGYYSNWIIKITPGHFNPEGAAQRVMCEDLGNTYDFDFNDVVYDVMNDVAHDQTIIQLQAAGGTLPIWVGINPSPTGHVNKDTYEAHNMLGGESSSTPINVDPGIKKDVAIYRISPMVTDIKNIAIYVKNGDRIETVTAILNGNFGTNGATYGNPLGEKGTSTVPMRFAVPSTVKWMNECKFIEEGYPKFKNWVQNEETYTDWYKTIGNLDIIHNGYTTDVPVTPGTIIDSDDTYITLTPATAPEFEGSTNIFSYVQIQGYTDKSAIWKALNAFGNDDKQVSFTYYFNKEVEAVMIPIYIYENKPYYVNEDGTRILITNEILSNSKDFKKATSQKDKDGNDRFTCTFGFSRRQLHTATGHVDGVINNDGSSVKYCDYILLYVKNQPTDLEITSSYYHY